MTENKTRSPAVAEIAVQHMTH